MNNRLRERISDPSWARVSLALTLTAVLMSGAVTTPTVQAQTLRILHAFKGSPDGANPWAGLVADTAGNFYSTTVHGGSAGYGTVFEVDSSGKEKVLYSFTGPDGFEPYAGVILDAANNIYGTTMYGGCCKDGTVFKINSSGKETVLHSFTGGTTDGCNPTMGLIEDKSGNLYGTTQACGSGGYGTVFKLSKKGKETVLHSFSGADGEFPNDGNLFMDESGNLYGVTSGGGSNNYGVVYKLSKSGKLTVLYNFAGGTTDGCYAYGPVTMDSAGNLYGTAIECGTFGYGVVWKLSTSGEETVLYNFAGGASDGSYPSGGVVLDSAGNLYGDTENGGFRNDGTIFELDPTGKETVLHTFSPSEGSSPVGGVLLDANGNLYGTALNYGKHYDGTVWSLTP